MNKQHVKGKNKEIKGEIASKKIAGHKSLDYTGFIGKKIVKIQGDYRDSTHESRKRH
ncbi:hypothetical protein CAter282_2373 [Collimonas arenae]|uniref:Uncharacterized protein n=1 Tax=Collimonas arenae TaxID=279058 RepID=A0A127QJ76_9BURK|nr:hypothetical protein [Collimonas arenae]AMP00242.1 hypothetical protein CAter10_2614 [Collimonas arenae]AMP10119.1 hypothetical protein CAter282_2373 [Collimonas arenae]